MGAAARWARGTPGTAPGPSTPISEHLVTTEGHGSRASLILFSVDCDCSGGSATFFPHSSARGKQWECPGLVARPSLPSPASSIATVASNTAATAASRSVHASSPSRGASPAGGPPLPVPRVTPPALLSRVLDMGAFQCPRCRLAFRSRQLLRVHLEKLCLGPAARSSSCLHGGDLLPEEGAQGTARKPQDIPVVWSWGWHRMGTGRRDGDRDRDRCWAGKQHHILDPAWSELG